MLTVIAASFVAGGNKLAAVAATAGAIVSSIMVVRTPARGPKRSAWNARSASEIAQVA